MADQAGRVVLGDAPGGIVVVARDATQLETLFEGGRQLAASRRERLTLLILSEGPEQPDWAQSTEQYAELDVDAYFLDGLYPAKEIRAWLKTHTPDLMGFAYSCCDLQSGHFVC